MPETIHIVHTPLSDLWRQGESRDVRKAADAKTTPKPATSTGRYW